MSDQDHVEKNTTEKNGSVEHLRLYNFLNNSQSTPHKSSIADLQSPYDLRYYFAIQGQSHSSLDSGNPGDWNFVTSKRKTGVSTIGYSVSPETGRPNVIRVEKIALPNYELSTTLRNEVYFETKMFMLAIQTEQIYGAKYIPEAVETIVSHNACYTADFYIQKEPPTPYLIKDPIKVLAMHSLFMAQSQSYVHYEAAVNIDIPINYRCLAYYNFIACFYNTQNSDKWDQSSCSLNEILNQIPSSICDEYKSHHPGDLHISLYNLRNNCAHAFVKNKGLKPANSTWDIDQIQKYISGMKILSLISKTVLEKKLNSAQFVKKTSGNHMAD